MTKKTTTKSKSIHQQLKEAKAELARLERQAEKEQHEQFAPAIAAALREENAELYEALFERVKNEHEEALAARRAARSAAAKRAAETRREKGKVTSDGGADSEHVGESSTAWDGRGGAAYAAQPYGSGSTY